MNSEALAWAWRKKIGGPVGKLILVKLADYADREFSTFAGQKRLAEECECDVRSVRRWLAEFEVSG